MPVDLHVHTIASDGTLSAAEAVRDALSSGLRGIAIADHDTMEAIPEALGTALGTPLDLYPAVEVSADHSGRELHIIGYLVRPDDPALNSALARVRADRLQRARRIVQRLQALDVGIEMADVERVSAGESVGRPHIAAALVDIGEVSEPQEAFRRYLRRGRDAYVDRYRIPSREAIQLIIGAGGLATLAHPGLGCPDEIIYTLAEWGLGALEAYHVDHTPTKTRHYRALAERRGLIVTGGTDSHGPQGPKPVRIGQVSVPDECGEALMQWGADNGRWPATGWPVPK